MFKDIFAHGACTLNIDWAHFANVRRAKMIQEGYNTTHINWELYAKVLEAKQNQIINR